MAEDYDQDLQKYLEDKCKEIAFRFDSVQLVCTMYDASKDETTMYVANRGNWYSRIESVRRFIRHEMKSDMNSCDDDDDSNSDEED